MLTLLNGFNKVLILYIYIIIYLIGNKIHKYYKTPHKIKI